MQSNSNTGLREQIAAAKTHEQIDSLLAQGRANYAHASFKTVRQWQATAERRRKELGTTPAPAPAPVAAPVDNGRAERRRARRAGQQ